LRINTLKMKKHNKPDSDYTIQRMLADMQELQRQGYSDDAELMAKAIWGDRQITIKEGASPEDALQAILEDPATREIFEWEPVPGSNDGLLIRFRVDKLLQRIKAMELAESRNR
jgi:hypothetical protein